MIVINEGIDLFKKLKFFLARCSERLEGVNLFHRSAPQPEMSNGVIPSYAVATAVISRLTLPEPSYAVTNTVIRRRKHYYMPS